LLSNIISNKRPHTLKLYTLSIFLRFICIILWLTFFNWFLFFLLLSLFWIINRRIWLLRILIPSIYLTCSSTNRLPHDNSLLISKRNEIIVILRQWIVLQWQSKCPRFFPWRFRNCQHKCLIVIANFTELLEDILFRISSWDSFFSFCTILTILTHELFL